MCLILSKGNELSHSEGSVLLVAFGIHHHLMTENLEGHSFTGRLSEEQDKLVVNMSKTLVRSRDICIY